MPLPRPYTGGGGRGAREEGAGGATMGERGQGGRAVMHEAPSCAV